MQPEPWKQALWVDGGVFSTSYLTRMSCISNFDSCASLGWSQLHGCPLGKDMDGIVQQTGEQ